MGKKRRYRAASARRISARRGGSFWRFRLRAREATAERGRGNDEEALLPAVALRAAPHAGSPLSVVVSARWRSLKGLLPFASPSSEPAQGRPLFGENPIVKHVAVVEDRRGPIDVGGESVVSFSQVTGNSIFLPFLRRSYLQRGRAVVFRKRKTPFLPANNARETPARL